MLSVIFLTVSPSFSQGLLKKVRSAVVNELLGDSDTGQANAGSRAEEPSCASDQAVMILDLGVYKLDYGELYVSAGTDGRILMRDRISGKYYIVKDGKTTGPFSETDPAVTGFSSVVEEDSENNSQDQILKKFRQFISPSGDKYLITFDGRKYGPFALISQFAVSMSGDKFAAVVTSSLPATESQGKEMEKMMEEAKTDQERMDLAMKFSQQMSQNIMNAGGTEAILPQLVTNVEGASFNPMSGGGTLSGDVKYNDVVIISMFNINDLKGNTLVTPGEDERGSDKIFINTDNSRYATYNQGTLRFNDKTELNGLFSPHFLNLEGKVVLAYMYYSPAKNGIMRHYVPF